VDTAAMRRSFEKVTANGDEVGLYFYSHLFLNHPDTRQMFPISMIQQRDRLLAALGDIVGRVDDLDKLVVYLQQLGRDHRKFGTLAEHYPAVGASLLATLAHFAGDDWTSELQADWAAAYELIAKVMIEGADEAADSPPWWDAKVVYHERRSIDVAVLRVQTESLVPYLAGQSVSVETELRPRLWRFYSVAGAPREDGTLELHVQAMDGGPVSSALVRQVGVGDVLRLGPPIGELTLDLDSDRDLLLVAGGTGLAPLKALVEQVAQLPVPRRVDLYVGARREEGLYDLEALTALSEQHTWLHVVPVVSDDDHYEGEKGLVGDVVMRDGPWNSRDIFVCGSTEMVRSTVAKLRDAKVPENRIRYEEFTPSRQTLGPRGSVQA
jgi:NAD(P)H-flavin reductase/hemoglobin-like flavoprotein